MTTFNYTLKTGKKITATAKKGNKPANWNPSGDHYRITITGADHPVSFDFWDSYANRGKNCDIRGALSCIAGDAISGNCYDSVDEIAEEFGYTKPSEAIRVFNALKATASDFGFTNLTDEELQELADY